MSEALIRARTKLVLTHPFFGCLLLSCKMTEDNSVPTAATDGKDLFYNAKFIASLKHEELMGLLAHEVGHKMFMHMSRKGQRDMRIWNVAADYAINIIIKEAGLILPAGARFDAQYANMTTEAIYDIIKQKVDDQRAKNDAGGNSDALSQALDDGEDIPDHLKEGQQLSAAEQSELEADIKTQIAQAASIAKQAGKLPDSIARLVASVLEPKVDWRKQLREFVLETAKSDYTFRRPSRRLMAHDLYMPSLTGTEMPPFALAFDTSGSIYEDQKTLEIFVAEINGVIQDCSPASVTVVYADSKVAGFQELEQDEEFVPALKGGGGTAFSATFDWLEEHETDFAGIIYFTDLEVSDFGFTDTPTMWAVHGNSSPQDPPFGTVIILED